MEKEIKTGYVIEEEKTDWIDKSTISKFSDKDFQRIISFFVFLSPCKSLSVRADFSAFYNWSAPWKKPYKLNEQLKNASSNPQLLFSAENYDAIESALEKSGLKNNFPNDTTKERACFYNNQKNQFMSLFYHIRNSFAHSRFSIKEDCDDWTFIFEDVGGKSKDKLSARMILKKSTLLKWIEIIEGGEKAFSERKL